MYLGYGTSFGDFSVDASLWSYNYPTGAGYTADGGTDFTEISDFILALGYGPVSFSWVEPIGSENSPGDYRYFTLGASYEQFSLTFGLHSDNSAAVSCPEDVNVAAGETCDPVHVNFDYAYNDNLTFTLSQFIADETVDDDLKFVVSYNIPLQ